MIQHQMIKPEQMVKFLGRRIALQDGQKRYKLVVLFGILSNELAIIGTSSGSFSLVEWSRLESPYMIVEQVDIKVE